MRVHVRFTSRPPGTNREDVLWASRIAVTRKCPSFRVDSVMTKSSISVAVVPFDAVSTRVITPVPSQLTVTVPFCVPVTIVLAAVVDPFRQR